MKIISFSGIDGAGKSTQIDAMHAWLLDAQLRTKLVTFWDNVVVFSRLREYMSHKAFKGDQGIGTPERPLVRRDKNVVSTPVTAVRFFFYLADAINLRLVVSRLKKSDLDVLIFDRYIYDELANLPLTSRLSGIFIRMVTRLAPRPDIAYVIDADPAAAFARKPEYPLEFLRSNRDAYIALSRLTGASVVVEPRSIDAMQAQIREAFLQRSSPLDKAFHAIPGSSLTR